MRVFMLSLSFFMQIYEGSAVQNRRIEANAAIRIDEFRTDKTVKGTQDKFPFREILPADASAVMPYGACIEYNL